MAKRLCSETHGGWARCEQKPTVAKALPGKPGQGQTRGGQSCMKPRLPSPPQEHMTCPLGRGNRGGGAGERGGRWGRQGEKGTGEGSFVRQQHPPRCQGARQGPRGPSHPAPSQMGPAARSSTSGALSVPAVTEDTETCPVPAWGSCRISANTKEHPDTIGGRWL